MKATCDKTTLKRNWKPATLTVVTLLAVTLVLFLVLTNSNDNAGNDVGGGGSVHSVKSSWKPGGSPWTGPVPNTVADLVLLRALFPGVAAAEDDIYTIFTPQQVGAAALYRFVRNSCWRRTDARWAEQVYSYSLIATAKAVADAVDQFAKKTKWSDAVVQLLQPPWKKERSAEPEPSAEEALSYLLSPWGSWQIINTIRPEGGDDETATPIAGSLVETLHRTENFESEVDQALNINVFGFGSEANGKRWYMGPAFRKKDYDDDEKRGMNPIAIRIEEKGY